MIWLLLGVFVYFAGLYVTFKLDQAFYRLQDAAHFIWGYFGIIFCIALIMILNVTIGHSTYGDGYWTHTGDTQIMALNDSSSINGHFGLMHGYIAEEERYFFYYQKDNGAIKQSSVRAYCTDIFEDEETEGWVNYFETHGHLRWKGWQAGAKGGCQNGHRYEIHVPKGTVIREFTLDLEK